MGADGKWYVQLKKCGIQNGFARIVCNMNSCVSKEEFTLQTSVGYKELQELVWERHVMDVEEQLRLSLPEWQRATADIDITSERKSRDALKQGRKEHIVITVPVNVGDESHLINFIRPVEQKDELKCELD